jgi:hypothetical protein
MDDVALSLSSTNGHEAIPNGGLNPSDQDLYIDGNAFGLEA